MQQPDPTETDEKKTRNLHYRENEPVWMVYRYADECWVVVWLEQFVDVWMNKM
jgi:hypothetical protein